MGGLGIVVNPYAGGNHRHAQRVARLTDLVGTAGWVREPRAFDELAGVVREYRDRGVDVLAVCGGDGSFFRVLSAAGAVYGGEGFPRFLPLRAGSMNTIANGLGCPRWSPERMVTAVVAMRERGGRPPVQSRLLLRVNGTHLGFMSGAGVIVGFLQAYYEAGRPGRLGAALVLGRLAASALTGGPFVARVLRRVEASVDSDGVRVPFETFSVLYASTIADIGLGFRPTYRAGERPDRFHLLAGPVTAKELLRVLGRIRRGVPTGSPHLADRLAQRVRIEFARPEPYMVDGDVLESTERLSIEAGPTIEIVTGVDVA